MIIQFHGTVKQIEQLANKVKELIKPYTDVRDYLFNVVESFGGRIKQAQEQWYNKLLIDPGGKSFEIGLSPYSSHLRDNFDIAHNLGHYFMHYDHSNPSADSFVINNLDNNSELQANRFAAEFLMPKEQFIEEFKKTDNVYYLASIFQVPKDAVEGRITSLKL